MAKRQSEAERLFQRALRRKIKPPADNTIEKPPQFRPPAIRRVKSRELVNRAVQAQKIQVQRFQAQAAAAGVPVAKRAGVPVAIAVPTATPQPQKTPGSAPSPFARGPGQGLTGRGFGYNFPEEPGAAAPAPTGGQSHEFRREATGHALGVFPAKPGGTGWQLLADHFNIPHSGNDGGPFAQFGQVWYNHDNGKYYLGLSFVGGKRFRYEKQPFNSSTEVQASLAGYVSISWAANPKSSHYDGGRFGPGTYTRV